ncbi:hypothetical protein H4R34_000298 [Dimargaris verticillata]|uniref:Vta1 like-domain-containing protein n=1 Tax=Dimargaris verticillata TaxID=2761393 RepID=A0A9W8B6V9_9FUNG|nr:hypothetical protein H4R34_000298 [Dimargaris verticillata]
MDPLATIPADLRFVGPYLQRARELATHEPIIAYYCQFYAVKLALARGGQAPETQAFLLGLVEDLETKKAALGQEPAILDDETSKSYLHNFALKVFYNADNEDRAGKASKKTGLTFLASTIFMELLRIFGDLPSDVEEKLKYAKWKAKEIVQALREGRAPTAGPPAPIPSQPSPTMVVDLPSDALPDQPSLDTSSPPPAAHPTPPVLPTPPPPSAALARANRAAPLQWTESDDALSELDYSEGELGMVDPDVAAKAEKHTRFALSAMQFDDVKAAIDNLHQALALLQPYDRRQT